MKPTGKPNLEQQDDRAEKWIKSSIRYSQGIRGVSIPRMSAAMQTDEAQMLPVWFGKRLEERGLPVKPDGVSAIDIAHH